MRTERTDSSCTTTRVTWNVDFIMISYILHSENRWEITKKLDLYYEKDDEIGIRSGVSRFLYRGLGWKYRTINMNFDCTTFE